MTKEHSIAFCEKCGVGINLLNWEKHKGSDDCKKWTKNRAEREKACNNAVKAVNKTLAR